MLTKIKIFSAALPCRVILHLLILILLVRFYSYVDAYSMGDLKWTNTNLSVLLNLCASFPIGVYFTYHQIIKLTKVDIKLRFIHPIYFSVMIVILICLIINFITYFNPFIELPHFLKVTYGYLIYPFFYNYRLNGMILGFLIIMSLAVKKPTLKKYQAIFGLILNIGILWVMLMALSFIKVRNAPLLNCFPIAFLGLYFAQSHIFLLIQNRKKGFNPNPFAICMSLFFLLATVGLFNLLDVFYFFGNLRFICFPLLLGFFLPQCLNTKEVASTDINLDNLSINV